MAVNRRMSSVLESPSVLPIGRNCCTLASNMKKVIPLLFVFALALWAADFWKSKPYTDWSQKEVQKIITDSPWAKKISVPLGRSGGPAAPNIEAEGPATSGGRGGRGGGAAPLGDASTSSGGGAGGARGTQGMRGGAGNMPDDVPQMTPAAQVVVRLQTALPVKQALVKAKYGADAGTAPEGKQFIEREEQFYVVSVSGLPGYVLPKDDQGKRAILQAASLHAKDKEALAPSDVQFDSQNRQAEALFLFPRKDVFTADDKEIEFVASIGGMSIKTKFRPKDMVFNGKLAM